MNILILNGSPKANYSITLQTSLYLQKIYREHRFSFINLSQKIGQYEKDITPFTSEAEKADIIIFSYPVYTLLAPWCLHRFIEIIREKNVDLEGRWATQITTSKHFYDTTAHRYVEDNLLDMGCRVIPGLSADMDDLLEEKGQKEARVFFDTILFSMKRDICRYTGRRSSVHEIRKYSRCISENTKDIDKKVSIVTNCAEDDQDLMNMIADFQSRLRCRSTVYNIREYRFRGSCMGCFSCAQTGRCVIKDGFDEYLRCEIQNADSLVFAFRIENHYTHSSLKMYEDRNFCNGHRQVTAGKPTCYIIAGDLEKEENLRTLIEARCSVGGNWLSYVATDRKDTESEITKAADSLSYALENDIERSRNFYGVGGNLIFRDLIWIMQGMMKADHIFYRQNGYYNFPQKQKKRILMMKMVGLLMKLPDRKGKMKSRMNSEIIKPYQKVINSIE